MSSLKACILQREVHALIGDAQFMKTIYSLMFIFLCYINVS